MKHVKPTHITDQQWEQALEYGRVMREAAGWEPVEPNESEEEAAFFFEDGAIWAYMALNGMSPFG